MGKVERGERVGQGHRQAQVRPGLRQGHGGRAERAELQEVLTELFNRYRGNCLTVTTVTTVTSTEEKVRPYLRRKETLTLERYLRYDENKEEVVSLHAPLITTTPTPLPAIYESLGLPLADPPHSLQLFLSFPCGHPLHVAQFRFSFP